VLGRETKLENHVGIRQINLKNESSIKRSKGPWGNGEVKCRPKGIGYGGGNRLEVRAILLPKKGRWGRPGGGERRDARGKDSGEGRGGTSDVVAKKKPNLAKRGRGRKRGLWVQKEGKGGGGKLEGVALGFKQPGPQEQDKQGAGAVQAGSSTMSKKNSNLGKIQS